MTPSRRAAEAVVVLVAALIFFGTVLSPPSLMDDVDAAYPQIARQMLETGDWVTARLNGVKYFDKPPGQVWAMAASFAVFGVHDWAARIPLAAAAVLLAWVTLRLGRWGLGGTAGFWAGLVMASCVGMWLFTRMRVPDAALTLTVTVSIWAILRLLEGDGGRGWAALLGASLGAGVLWKGLPAIVFPAAATCLFLIWERRLLAAETWRRLRLGMVALALIAVAAPWHIAAILANPPYFELTLRSEPDVYRGFFWRYFINEHILRYLGLRYPKDYATVPAVWYWLMHLVWLFPWSPLLPAAARLPFRSDDRAGRLRRMAVCWAGFVLVFFALSTSQEYYTMSAYPALALLVGDAAARGGRWLRGAVAATAAVCTLALAAIAALLVSTAGVEAAGDIARSLSSNPEAYTLALGHMQDLTLESFAWLRGPLAVAGLAFLLGAVQGWRWRDGRALIAFAAMMVVFFQAARWAMVSFDPYLSSRPLADAYYQCPEGRLVLDDQYYSFSSLVFYTNENVLLLNGRVNNIAYGSYAPDAPDPFVDEAELLRLWRGPGRVYLATFVERIPALKDLLGPDFVFVIEAAGDKALLTNRLLVLE